MAKTPKPPEAEWAAAFALMLAETGVRNSALEELHMGVSPETAVGDYSDVKVVTPYGEIPWSQLSRIDDEEMKGLMIQVVDRLYTILSHPDAFTRLMGAGRWNRPQLHPGMMDSVARWKARQAGMAEAEVQATWPLDESKRPASIRSEQRVAADQADQDRLPERWSFETTPEAMRQLARAPIADPAWIARAREALARGADGWERAQMETRDVVDEATFGQDER